MKAIGSSFLGRGADLGPLLLRLGLGAVFVMHGYMKYEAGVAEFAGTLESLGVPFPTVLAWATTASEGIGGLLLILGLLTRLVTIPLAAVMVGAIILVKVDVGFIVEDAAGAELDTALLAGLLCLLFVGPGRLSVDGIMRLETAAGPGRRPQAAKETRAA